LVILEDTPVFVTVVVPFAPLRDMFNIVLPFPAVDVEEIFTALPVLSPLALTFNIPPVVTLFPIIVATYPAVFTPVEVTFITDADAFDKAPVEDNPNSEPLVIPVALEDTNIPSPVVKAFATMFIPSPVVNPFPATFTMLPVVTAVPDTFNMLPVVVLFPTIVARYPLVFTAVDVTFNNDADALPNIPVEDNPNNEPLVMPAALDDTNIPLPVVRVLPKDTLIPVPVVNAVVERLIPVPPVMAVPDTFNKPPPVCVFPSIVARYPAVLFAEDVTFNKDADALPKAPVEFNCNIEPVVIPVEPDVAIIPVPVVNVLPNETFIPVPVVKAVALTSIIPPEVTLLPMNFPI
jgi:hypothetical protein